MVRGIGEGSIPLHIYQVLRNSHSAIEDDVASLFRYQENHLYTSNTIACSVPVMSNQFVAGNEGQAQGDDLEDLLLIPESLCMPSFTNTVSKRPGIVIPRPLVVGGQTWIESAVIIIIDTGLLRRYLIRCQTRSERNGMQM